MIKQLESENERLKGELAAAQVREHHTCDPAELSLIGSLHRPLFASGTAQLQAPGNAVEDSRGQGGDHPAWQGERCRRARSPSLLAAAGQGPSVDNATTTVAARRTPAGCRLSTTARARWHTGTAVSSEYGNTWPRTVIGHVLVRTCLQA
eukprot:384954-Prymnesium_polylepis.2